LNFFSCSSSLHMHCTSSGFLLWAFFLHIFIYPVSFPPSNVTTTATVLVMILFTHDAQCGRDRRDRTKKAYKCALINFCETKRSLTTQKSGRVSTRKIPQSHLEIGKFSAFHTWNEEHTHKQVKMWNQSHVYEKKKKT
jgi:hypothetical protein